MAQPLENLKTKLKKKLEDLQNSFNFDPSANAGRNFWTSPVGNILAKAQEGVSAVNQAKRVEIPKPQVNNQVAQTAINLAAGIPESIINIPRNVIVGGSRIGTELGETIRDKRNINLQNLAGGVAPMAEGFFDAASFGLAGVGKNIAKTAVKEAVKRPMIKLVAKGAAKGAVVGGAGGLTYGLDNQYGKKFNTGEVLTNVAAGSVLGGAVGGSIAGFGALKGLINRPDQLDQQLRDKAGRWAAGQTPVKPEGMPKAQWDFQIKFNEKYKRNPYTPVMQSDLEEALKKEANKRIGLQVRNVRDDTLPTQPKGVPEAPKPVTKILPQEPMKVRGMQQVPEVAPKLNMTGDGSGAKPPSNPSLEVSIAPQKYAGSINTERLDLTPDEKQTLRTTIESVKPELDQIKGKPLSHDEVISAAKQSEVLQQVTTREQTLQAEAALLKARQQMTGLDKEVDQLARSGNTAALKTKMADLIDSLRVVNSNASDKGRQLNALKIEAGEETVRQSILKQISTVESDTEKILKEAVNVDWDNANSIATFYRKFIKPSTMELLDEYRYNNMLSNPRTHIRNAFSNLVQTYVTRPATILAQGDIKGAAQYYKGAVAGLPSATEEFMKSISGRSGISKPDIEQIPTKKLPGVLTIPTRLMEASDRFFSKLITEGELARGTGLKEAGDVAEYSLFRQGLKPKGQGKLLNAIDEITAWTYKAPKPVRWFVPFIRTPMNFAKQWIEYSPAGTLTLIGAGNKKEQLAKTIVGSTVMAVGARLALDGNTTWEAPTDPKQKELFYASGRKPFSVKIGDKWVSMMYAGPFAMALALPSAAKHYNDESRTALTDDQIEKMSKIAMSSARFLSGQTFLEGVNNFVKFFSGDADYSMPGNLAFSAGQVIPLEGLVRWITTAIDPVYRKAEGTGTQKFLQTMQSNIPFASQSLTPYTGPEGAPSTRERYNLVTPYDITPNKPEYEQPLQDRTDKLQMNAVINKKKKEIEKNKAGKFEAEGKLYYWNEEKGIVSTKTLNKSGENAEKKESEKKTGGGKTTSKAVPKKISIKTSPKMPTIKFMSPRTKSLKLSSSKPRATRKLKLKKIAKSKLKIKQNYYKA